jgi:hypothetical protein
VCAGVRGSFLYRISALPQTAKIAMIPLAPAAADDYSATFAPLSGAPSPQPLAEKEECMQIDWAYLRKG